MWRTGRPARSLGLLVLVGVLGLSGCGDPAGNASSTAAPTAPAATSAASSAASSAAPSPGSAEASSAVATVAERGSCTSPEAPGRPSLVAYGDSITQGDSGPAAGVHGELSWYSWLVCSGVFADGGNQGVSGETAAQVLARLQRDAPRADVFVLAAGTNDLRVGTPTAQTVADLDAALDLAAQAAPTVLLATVQPWTGTDATALNAEVRRLAQEHGARLVDFASTISAPGAAPDGVHPSAATARRLADLVAAAAG